MEGMSFYKYLLCGPPYIWKVNPDGGTWGVRFPVRAGMDDPDWDLREQAKIQAAPASSQVADLLMEIL